MNRRFSIFAWLAVIYVLGVILWGAYVRATGSGAGCGNHWPLCNGEVVPRSPSAATWIEFTHRLSSGLALLAVVLLLVWAFRAFPRGSLVRTGALLSLIFMMTEALVGAGLVLFELVAGNQSLARALVMAVHLINTFLLLAAMVVTAWSATQPARLKFRMPGGAGWLLAAALVGLLVLGASGAVTALGDTLFPAGSLAEAFRQDLSPTTHLLIRLRLYHPWIAIASGVLLIVAAGAARTARPEPAVHRFARLATALFLVQLGAGAVNFLLLAPIWLQMIHLLLADLIWISAILLAAATATVTQRGTAATKSPEVLKS